MFSARRLQKLSLPILLATLVVVGLWAGDRSELSKGASRSEIGDSSYSNIMPGDYVGPASCAECHEAKYERWKTHPHSRMNQKPSPETVRGDFSGVRIHYGPGDAVFHEEDGNYYMSLFIDEELVRRLRVTLVVGSRFYQFYVGVQDRGPEPKSHECYRVEAKLPFGYSFRLSRWLPELYFDSYPPKEYSYDGDRSFADVIFHEPPDHEWNDSCVSCHNTLPYALRFKGDGGWKKGFPDDDISLSKDPSNSLLSWARQSLPIESDELVTFGISCEGCHFGGREHAVHGKPMSFVPRHTGLKIRGLEKEETDHPRESPYVINSICRQCHAAKVDRYENGSAQWNSAEAVDMSKGACASRILCTNCHDPHRPGPPEGAPDRDNHVAACLECHSQYRDPVASRAHSRHSTSVNCLDCHMPKSVQGLELRVRSHTISSPTDLRMLEAAEPNACNLCHLDRPVSWTVRELNEGWNAGISVDPSWRRVYAGSLKRPVGLAWLRSENPVVRLIAAQAFSESKLDRVPLEEILSALTSDYAVNRLFGFVAIEKIAGRTLSDEDYDLLASPERRKEQVRSLRRELCPSPR